MPETCIVLKQNKIGIISASGWLFKKKSITMHGNVNVMSNSFSVGQEIPRVLWNQEVH
jgi:hypothetical protein